MLKHLIRNYSTKSPPPAEGFMQGLSNSTLIHHTPSSLFLSKEFSKLTLNTTKKLNLYQAVNEALITILDSDKKACVFGEDVQFGGVFRCSMGLAEKFGMILIIIIIHINNSDLYEINYDDDCDVSFIWILKIIHFKSN